jgi:cell wall assembly regulator SMI1
MTDYADLWKAIDGLLAVHAPRALAQLRGPITAPGLAWMRAVARKGGVRAIDAAVAATYLAHDGAREGRSSILALLPVSPATEWARSCEWHSSWISREELATWQSALGAADERGEEDDDEGVPGWPSRWMPIGRDGGGNAVVVSLESGELFAFDHEVGEPVSLTMLGSFLVELELDLRAGLVGDDDEGALHRGERAARPAPKRAQHDEAASLMALLAEKNLVDLAPTASLREALGAALAVKSRKARDKKVMSVLYGHDDVAEVFADDDVLAVILDEFG